MAVVYRAHDRRLDRRVALKLLSPELAGDTAFRTRFIRESRATVAVDHPHIVPVFDAGEADGSLYIAMRYVQGGDARSLLAGDAGEAGLAPERAWMIISQVAGALDAAHEHGLIHRDVKPANILLENDHVYLSDFGISRLAITSRVTTAGQLVGTLDYIAPESIKGQAIDGSVDQYSLACSAFELLTGHAPFHADLGLAVLHAHISAPPPPVTRSRPDLPQAVDLVITKAMAKRAADRYPTCTDFSADLGKALGVVPGTPVIGAAAARVTAMPDANAAQPAPALHPDTEVSAAPARPATEFASPVIVAYTPPPQQILIPRPTPPPQQIPLPQQLYGQNGRPTGNQWSPPAPATGQNWQQPYPPQPYPPQPYPAQSSPSSGTVVAIVCGTIAVAIVAVVAVLIVTNLTKPGPTPKPTVAITRRTGPAPTPSPTGSGPASEEASAVNTLLLRSAATLRPLLGLSLDVHYCHNLGYDYSRITQIASQRAGELATAKDLDVAAIPDGAKLKSELITALQTSQDADEEYVSWANAEINGCDPSSDYDSPYFQRAYSDDLAAKSQKRVFLADWASVAKQYGYDQSPQF